MNNRIDIAKVSFHPLFIQNSDSIGILLSFPLNVYLINNFYRKGIEDGLRGVFLNMKFSHRVYKLEWKT